MEIKVKKLHPDAKLPWRGTADAAGLDLYCTRSAVLAIGETAKLPTGLAMEIPTGYCGVVYSRSSSAVSGLLITPLIVDADYRGEIMVIVKNGTDGLFEVKAGSRIAQLRIEKLENAEFVWAEELSETARGTGGYGSTGR